MVTSLGDFCVGVAAFPEEHREAAALDADAHVMEAKADAGADFAITQLFFRADDYVALVERCVAVGSTMPIIPGIMPITNLGQIKRFAELSGGRSRPRWSPGSTASRSRPTYAIGVEIATELCDELLDQGAPGLHFYTLNRSRATSEIYAALDLPA